MKTSPLLFIAILVTIVLFAGCSGGGIPIDEERARQHIIKVREAKTFTASLREGIAMLNRRMGDTTTLRDSFSIPFAETFNRDAIALLLNQEGADGVRIYLGRNAKRELCMILVPVDKNGRNIIKNLIGTRTAFIPGVSSAYAQDDGEAIETGQRCPHLCDDTW
ncbi:MAG TPA: hypothetical protein VD993_10150 [Chitinophagaceae bacterium]|nr:hypothetical protein [Chitinophagaceae bacterium]